jgi:hypothetical protein
MTGGVACRASHTVGHWSGGRLCGTDGALAGGLYLFVVYEAVAMLSALAIYAYLATTGRLRGAGVISLSIVVNLAAAGVQASDLSIQIIFPFDHNGIFHLIQMVGVAMLGVGVGMERDSGGRLRQGF